MSSGDPFAAILIRWLCRRCCTLSLCSQKNELMLRVRIDARRYESKIENNRIMITRKPDDYINIHKKIVIRIQK